MTENEKIELFDKWYDENYDEWAEGEEGIALREELEQAFKSGIATLEKENAELEALEGQTPWKDIKDKSELVGKLTKAKEIIRMVIDSYNHKERFSFEKDLAKAEQFISEVEK